MRRQLVPVAVLIVDDGVVVGQWGEVDRKWPCYAIRRGFLPKRGSHPPGTFWLHNNWDVNALGTIYEQATKWSVFSGFDRLIALPLQIRASTVIRRSVRSAVSAIFGRRR
jgi:hypothetical protein